MFKINMLNVINAVLVFLMLTLNIFHTLFSSVSIVDFGKVILWWTPREKDSSSRFFRWYYEMLSLNFSAAMPYIIYLNLTD